MKKHSFRYTAALAGSLALLLSGAATAQTPQIPQVPAFLPQSTDVPASQPMPIDGVWKISTIGKRIRIEAGRAFAVDPWLHLLVLQVQPGMVVIQDITPTAAGEYSGRDLPLMGQWTARVEADGSIHVDVAGALGPASYSLIPIELDNHAWHQQEMVNAGLIPEPVAPAQPAQAPAYQIPPPPGAPAPSASAPPAPQGAPE